MSVNPADEDDAYTRANDAPGHRNWGSVDRSVHHPAPRQLRLTSRRRRRSCLAKGSSSQPLVRGRTGSSSLCCSVYRILLPPSWPSLFSLHLDAAAAPVAATALFLLPPSCTRGLGVLGVVLCLGVLSIPTPAGVLASGMILPHFVAPFTFSFWINQIALRIDNFQI